MLEVENIYAQRLSGILVGKSGCLVGDGVPRQSSKDRDGIRILCFMLLGPRKEFG